MWVSLTQRVDGGYRENGKLYYNGEFIIEESKEDIFCEFSKIDIRFNNISAIIQFHKFEYEKDGKISHLYKINNYKEQIKKLVSERASLLLELLNSTYDFETLNNENLQYYYSFAGKEIIIYNECSIN